MAESLERVGLAARRIFFYAESIEQAHSLGLGPGSHDELWSMDFHRAAVWIYEETLPWAYLVPLARGFCDIAALMGEHTVPTSAPHHWRTVAEYLHNAGTVLLGHAPPEATAMPPAEDLADRTPAVMRFDALAQMASAEGARTLRLAADDVASSIETAVGSARPDLSDEELSVLRSLATGRRMVEIAEEHGLSERSLYRMLRDIWRTLGATSRMEGMAIAIREGLLDD